MLSDEDCQKCFTPAYYCGEDYKTQKTKFPVSDKYKKVKSKIILQQVCQVKRTVGE